MAQTGQGRSNRQVRKVQRVAAYAVIIRDDRILLSRLAERLTSKELWTLPGGGLEHGEDPRDAVVREVHEETGLDVEIDETAHVYSSHQSNTWRQGRRADAHALRIVYDGWVPVDAPSRGSSRSTARRWRRPGSRSRDVLDGTVPTVSLVTEVLEQHRTFRLQRVAAYALVVRDGAGAAHPQLAPAARTRAAGPCPAAASTTARTRGTAWSARSARRPGWPARRGGARRDSTALRGHRAVGAHARTSTPLQVVFEGTRRRPASRGSSRPGGTTDAAAWVRLAGLGEDRTSATWSARPWPRARTAP